jgi:hypothetical protein
MDGRTENFTPGAKLRMRLGPQFIFNLFFDATGCWTEWFRFQANPLSSKPVSPPLPRPVSPPQFILCNSRISSGSVLGCSVWSQKKMSLETAYLTFKSREPKLLRLINFLPSVQNSPFKTDLRAGLPDFSRYSLPKREKYNQITTQYTKWP